ncbi:LysR family transcriptional regulator, glycine cleavage system transcriptional activator [Amphritea atlantica]|uniref:LysR family transcriptional regulator, glycine cleavage system transcriptional activator n=1 Tax=Amphritea atlantica TaxID=355243 RepID=A0A1H9D2N8_9GAMM|nr:LysR substrate-binding domain-containing protein [Amphritea atlantica]SEQ07627.1 LysR family transcriptional regulator, glycine cleavage system transcriptional activator [Amphritea atlantica]
MTRLPSLKALQAFRHAAEMQSFKLAAEQLYVSQAAISQQIKTLEQQLGVTLFHRLTREIELTSEGRQLLPYVSKAFASLEQGVNQLNDDPHPQRLILSTLPSFASRWLVPRLGDFQAQEEHLNIHISPGIRLDSFDDNQLDLAIRFGKGVYPGLSSRLLMRDYMIPVCHPSLINKDRPARQQLGELPLLTDDAPDMKDLWPLLRTALGLPETLTSSRLQVTDSNILVEALLSGQGIAAARFSLVYEMIERGQLICPLPIYLPSSFDYYLVAPEHHFRRPKIQRFETWLRQQTEEISHSWERFRQQHQIT